MSRAYKYIMQPTVIVSISLPTDILMVVLVCQVLSTLLVGCEKWNIQDGPLLDDDGMLMAKDARFLVYVNVVVSKSMSTISKLSSKPLRRVT